MSHQGQYQTCFLQALFGGQCLPSYSSLLCLMSPPILNACPWLENLPGSHLSWLRSLLTSSTVIHGSLLLSPHALQWPTSCHSYQECHTQHHGFWPCPLSQVPGPSTPPSRNSMELLLPSHEVQLHFPSVLFWCVKSQKVATSVSQTPNGIFPSMTTKPLTYWCQRPRHCRECSEFLPW